MKKGSKATKPYKSNLKNCLRDEPGFREEDLEDVAPSMHQRVLAGDTKPDMSVEECREVFWRLAEKREINPFVKLYIQKLEAKLDVLQP